MIKEGSLIQSIYAQFYELDGLERKINNSENCIAIVLFVYKFNVDYQLFYVNVLINGVLAKSVIHTNDFKEL